MILPTVESHERILLGHVDPHRFMVEMFFDGLFSLKSLETVQAE